MPDFPTNITQTQYQPPIGTDGVDGQQPVGGTEIDKDGVVLLDSTQNSGGVSGTTDNFVTSRIAQPTVTTNQTDISSTREKLGSINSETLTVDIYSIMALFQKIAQEQRDTGREMRQSSLQAQVTALTNSANEMRQAAQERMIGGIVSGAMQLAGGLVQVGSGIMSGIQAGQAGAKLKESQGLETESMSLKEQMLENEQGARDYNKSMGGGLSFEEAQKKGGFVSEAMMENKKLDLQNQKLEQQIGQLQGQVKGIESKAQTVQSVGQGVSGALGGIGTIVNSVQERKAAEHDARKTDLETQAKVFESNVQQSNDVMSQMLDVIRDIRDKLGSVEQSNTETNRGIARNI